MEDLIGFLIPVIFVLIAVINGIARMKKQKGPSTPRRAGEPDWAYTARNDDIRRFLQEAGIAPRQTPSQASAPPPPPSGVVPQAPRARGAQPGAPPQAPQQPRRAPRVRAPRPAPVEDSGATRRVVTDAAPVATSFGRPTAPVGQFSSPPTAGETPRVEKSFDEMTIEERLQLAGREGVARAVGHRAGSAARATIGVHKTPKALADKGRRGFAIPALDAHGIKQAFVLSEILRPPLALREGGWESR